MKRIAKKLCLIVAATMLFSVIAVGCGATKSKEEAAAKTVETSGTQTENTGTADAQTPDISKEVQLKMYLLGDPSKDYNLMLTELNNHMKKDLNATLKVNWISWGDFSTKYSLVLASGEPFDLIYTSNWAYYAESANKNAFTAMDDLLPKYAPKTYAEMPKIAFEQAKIKGKVYMLPMNFDEINPHGWVVRGDLRKKYNIPEIKTIDDFGTYLDAVAKNEKEMIPYNAGPKDVDLIPAQLTYAMDLEHKDSFAKDTFLYDMKDAAAKPVFLPETKAFADFVKKMRTWYQNGYWSKSVLQNKTNAIDTFINGKSASLIANLGEFSSNVYGKLYQSHADWDVEWFQIGADTATYVNPYINNGMAIPVVSTNPERAMMFLEKVHQDQEYYDLVFYGIKGKHYELTADNKLDLPAGLKAEDNGYPAGAQCPWGFLDNKFFRYSKNAWPGETEVKNYLVSKAVIPTLLSFTFNTENVKNEVSAMQSLSEKYTKPMITGMVDPDKYLAEYLEQCKKAGLDKLRQEAQKQVDEYLKSK
jgi:putative aldouronate transport system substrate-binding protein